MADPTVERVRKLLELAKSGNVHEAALAASMAADLMTRYQFSEACLEDGPAAVERRAVQEESGVRRACMWQACLADTLGKHLHVSVVYITGSDRIDAVGRGPDVAALALLYHYVRGQLARMAEEAWGTANHGLARLNGGKVRFVDTFMRGARTSIDERMSERRRQTVGEQSDPGAALVRLDTYAQEAAEAVALWKRDSGMRTRTTSRMVRDGGNDAYSAGAAAGHRVGLTPDPRTLPARRS